MHMLTKRGGGGNKKAMSLVLKLLKTYVCSAEITVNMDPILSYKYGEGEGHICSDCSYIYLTIDILISSRKNEV